jgi:hypothetical protein
MAEMSIAATFLVDGIPQSYISEVEDDVNSEDKIVKTLRLGVAGHSNGAAVCRINFKGVIPLEGREIDYKDRCLEHRTTNLGIRMGSKTITVRGRFLNVKERSSVDNPNDLEGSFEGRVIRNS